MVMEKLCNQQKLCHDVHVVDYGKQHAARNIDSKMYYKAKRPQEQEPLVIFVEKKFFHFSF